MFLPPERFATARLTARPPRVEDAEMVFESYASDPAVTRYLSWRTHETAASVAKFLADRVAVWAAPKAGDHVAWLLEMPGMRLPVGSIGMSVEEGKALFGYALTRQCWGQGLAAEALRWLADWSLEQPGIFRAWAYCDVENAGSARVMEKAGMQREGLLRRWHVCPNLGSELRDCWVYAKVR